MDAVSLGVVHHRLTRAGGPRTHEPVPASHEAQVDRALASAIPGRG